ncbi:WecB/TagA/CpsF family glycosyltransferase [Thermodesulfobacteriota bacterium]
MKPTDCEDILGFPVTTRTREECIDQICDWIRSNEKGRYFVCANPHSLEIARTDRLFTKAVLAADMVTPDGVGMLVASRMLGGRIQERITGSGIFRELSRVLDRNGKYRYFFLGSTEENLARLQDKVQKRFSNIEIVGTHSPPFKNEFSDDESQIMIDAVNNAQPDVLWVGMTQPKQEKWIYQHKDKLNVSFIGAVGAVFDFYVGTVKRDYPWFLSHGLEWLPRLIQEPRRLWNRMFVSAPLFLMRVLLQRLRRGKR